MSSMSIDFAIIGAGTAGCFIANLLDEVGFNCVLIEKSRGLGGRCSRRRIGDGDSIDLGASGFSTENVKTVKVHEKLDAWIDAGNLVARQYPSRRFDGNDESVFLDDVCAKPSMNAFHKTMAGHINALTACKVHSLEKNEGEWQLLNEQGVLIASAKNIIITSPPEQALTLIKGLDGFNDIARISQKSLPQYVCAIEVEQALDTAIHVYQGGHAILDKAICEPRKPNDNASSGLKQVWMLHSTYDWAKEQVDCPHQDAAIAMNQAFCQHVGIESAAILTSHYWCLARHGVEKDQSSSCIWNSELQIGCCGDWLETGDMAGALNSAQALFEKITLEANENLI